jgi:hypothetical protein
MPPQQVNPLPPIQAQEIAAPIPFWKQKVVWIPLVILILIGGGVYMLLPQSPSVQSPAITESNDFETVLYSDPVVSGFVYDGGISGVDASKFRESYSYTRVPLIDGKELIKLTSTAGTDGMPVSRWLVYNPQQGFVPLSFLGKWAKTLPAPDNLHMLFYLDENNGRVLTLADIVEGKVVRIFRDIPGVLIGDWYPRIAAQWIDNDRFVFMEAKISCEDYNSNSAPTETAPLRIYSISTNTFTPFDKSELTSNPKLNEWYTKIMSLRAKDVCSPL